MHLAYLYVEQDSDIVAVKGGTLIEWVVDEVINPLPYIGNNSHSRYLQSYMFRGCVTEKLEPDMCRVETVDYKRFKVYMLSGNWSNWKAVWLDDIYFTYNDILKDNKFWLKNIEKLASLYNNLVIEKTDEYVEITFPMKSINNMSFFASPILPAHMLFLADKEFYISEYLSNIVNSTCVQIWDNTDIKNNVILDFTTCPEYNIKNYQFLILENKSDILKYLSWQTNIDIYQGKVNYAKDMFDRVDVILDNYYTIFFNTKSSLIDKNMRKNLSIYLSEKLKSEVSLQNNIYFTWYLFRLPTDNFSLDNIKKDFQSKLKTFEKEEILKNLQLVTNKVMDVGNMTWDQISKPFYIKNKLLSKDNVKLIWTIESWVDGVWVSANGKPIYWLKMYKKWDTKFTYIFWLAYGNLNVGENNFRIYTRANGKITQVWETKMYYQNASGYIKDREQTIKVPKIKLLYPDDWWNIWLIGEKTAKYLVDVFWSWNVEIKNIATKQEATEILQSTDYDIVIWDINIYHNKDISWLFNSSSPVNNPTLYSDSVFSSLIWQYFLSDDKVTNQIYQELQGIYLKNIPLIFVWKEKQSLFVKSTLKNEDIWDIWSFEDRKKFIKKLELIHMSQVKFSKFTLNGFWEFIWGKL